MRSSSKTGLASRRHAEVVYRPFTDERSFFAIASSMKVLAKRTTSVGFSPSRVKHLIDSMVLRSAAGRARAGISKVEPPADLAPIASSTSAITGNLRPVSAAIASSNCFSRTAAVLVESIGCRDAPTTARSRSLRPNCRRAADNSSHALSPFLRVRAIESEATSSTGRSFGFSAPGTPSRY